MSELGRWAYTAPCTLWQNLGFAENGDPLGWSAPQIIMCEYQGGLSAKITNIGTEIAVNNTFWTEFPWAKRGDYMLIGASDVADPIEAGADEVIRTLQYADTFDRLTDDWVILTGG